MKIKSTRQFKERVDAAFETQKTRDEAKACYDFQREEFKAQEEELCAYAAANPEVFEGRDGVSGWGQTDSVEYTMTNGTSVERADGGKLTDGEFLKSAPEEVHPREVRAEQGEDQGRRSRCGRPRRARSRPRGDGEHEAQGQGGVGTLKG